MRELALQRGRIFLSSVIQRISNDKRGDYERRDSFFCFSFSVGSELNLAVFLLLHNVYLFLYSYAGSEAVRCTPAHRQSIKTFDYLNLCFWTWCGEFWCMWGELPRLTCPGLLHDIPYRNAPLQPPHHINITSTSWIANFNNLQRNSNSK